MKRNQLEQKMFEKFEAYESDLDLNQAWETLERKRRKPRRKGIIIFIFGIGIFGAGLTFHFTNPDNLSASVSENSAQKYIETQPLPTSIIQEKTDRESEAIIMAGKPSEISSIKLPYVKKESTVNFHSKSNPEQENLAKDNDFDLLHPQISSIEIEPSGPSLFSTIPLVAMFNPIKRSELHLLEFRRMDQPMSSLIPLMLPRRKNKNWWIGISLSYGKSYKTLQAKDQTQSELAQLQDQLIRPLDAFSLELLIEKKIRRNFYLKGGLIFAHRTDRLDDQYERNYTELRPEQLVEVIRKPNGTEEFIYEEAEVQLQEATTTTKYLRNQLFSIPLLAGFEFPVKNNLSFRIYGGMAYSFLIKHRGQTFETINSRGTYVDRSTLPYKKSGLWQALATLEVNYKFNSNTMIFFGLNSSFDMNNLQKANSGIIEKYQFLGGQIGIKKSLPF